MRKKLVLSTTAAALVMAGAAMQGMLLPNSEAAPSAETIQLFVSGSEALRNVPDIGRPKRADRGIYVLVTNRGTTTLSFYGTDSGYLQQINEVARYGQWCYAWHDWCGTGKEDQFIKPGETVLINFNEWSEPEHERSLAVFVEVGTTRRGVVVVASE